MSTNSKRDEITISKTDVLRQIEYARVCVFPERYGGPEADDDLSALWNRLDDIDRARFVWHLGLVKLAVHDPCFVTEPDLQCKVNRCQSKRATILRRFTLDRVLAALVGDV